MKRFRWWRRLMGGTWYKLHYKYNHASPPYDFIIWSRQRPVENTYIKILETENYYL